MTDKDPKDMTASDLLRSVADGCRSTYPGIASSIDLLRTTFGVDMRPAYWQEVADTVSVIADKIDTELAQARRSGLERAAKSWAKANGWPDFRDGEDFGAWLDRCTLPRPRFEDGEPVQFGDEVAGSDECGIILREVAFCGGGTVILLDETPETICEVDPGERVKRPAPEALGADGKPIKVDETVYPTYGSYIGEPCKVLAVLGQDNVRVSVPGGGNERFDGCYLTHTPPDTQEKIDEDALKNGYEYWGCFGISCAECPSIIDGKRPYERYQCERCCLKAMKLDLLCRQRELDKRTGGAE